MVRKAVPFLAAASLALAATAAHAQQFVGDLCQSTVAPAAPHYDSAEQVRWYKRFWTGECDHLVGCFPGSPNWNAIMRQLLSRAPPAERAQLTPRVCRLGQMVGLDWSREHAVRRISTADLRTLYGLLEQGDPMNGVARAEAAVRAKLGL